MSTYTKAFTFLFLISLIITLRFLIYWSGNGKSDDTREQQTSEEMIFFEEENHMELFDIDENGKIDCIENMDEITDTDGDGLSDYQEFVYTETNPVLEDTDGDGISDFDADEDGDGISNGREHSLHTNPLLPDTDMDGLNDLEETETYFTDPLNSDTDNDGATDGWEVEHRFSPTGSNSSFTVNMSCQSSSLTAKTEMTVNGTTAQSVRIEAVSDPLLPNNTAPGYLGPVFEFSADGDIGLAKISFALDPAIVANGSLAPTVYCLNEETQQWYALDTVIENNTATAVSDHFSKYTVIDKNAYNEYLQNLRVIDYSQDSGKDTNNDGISDFLTQLMCDGVLRTGSGAMVFGNASFEEVQQNDDFDGDGLKNGEEIAINYQIPVDSDATEFNGHYYKRYDFGYIWDDVKSFCESMGGYIVTITSAEEQSFVEKLLSEGTQKTYWLGATDTQTEGEWKWVTGEPWSYENWAYGEPNNDGTEDFAEIKTWDSYRWNDGEREGDFGDYSKDNHGFVCEWSTQFANSVGYVYIKTSPILNDTDRDGFTDDEDPTPNSATAFKTMDDYIALKFGHTPNISILARQPVEGSRKELISDTGHTFLRIDDGKGNVRCVGFFPAEFALVTKISTVLNIYTRGYYTISGATGDESTSYHNVGYTVQLTDEEYQNALKYINKNSKHWYNIQNYNCTTFAVNAFSKAKPEIRNIIKKHFWSINPALGGATLTLFYPYGYSPADTAEDIRSNVHTYTIVDKLTLNDDAHSEVYALFEKTNE